jgi:hypothetical protein
VIFIRVTVVAVDDEVESEVRVVDDIVDVVDVVVGAGGRIPNRFCSSKLSRS